MSWYIRKSISLGPLRFNLSKSGIGTSFGVTGARIGTGPSGTYVHLGRYGIYYKQYLNRKRLSSFNSNSYNPSNDQVIIGDDIKYFSSKETDSFRPPYKEDLLNELNLKANRKSLCQISSFIFWGICSIKLLFEILLNFELINDTSGIFQSISQKSWVYLIGLAVIYLLLLIPFYNKDKNTVFSYIFYDFDQITEKKINGLLKFFETLKVNKKLWYVISEYQIGNFKFNSGASKTIDKEDLIIKRNNPFRIISNIEVFSFQILGQTFFFYPDHILVYSYKSNTYGSIDYSEIEIKSSIERFIEENNVPSDSKIIDRTWANVNVNGGPDRRFQNNKTFPVVEYGYLNLTSTSGLNLLLSFSNTNTLNEIEQLIKSFVDIYKNDLPSLDNTKMKDAYQKETREKLYILDITNLNDLKLGDIKQAYHKKTKQYHPDNFDALPLELKDLARSKMVEIDNAYSFLVKFVTGLN